MTEIIISVLTSSIVAAVISFWLNKNREEKRYKKLLLDDILGYRYQIAITYDGDNTKFVHALNRIFLVFNNKTEVIEALKSYQANSCNDNLIYLIKEMCKDVGIKQDNIIDSFLLNPLVARSQSTRQ